MHEYTVENKELYTYFTSGWSNLQLAYLQGDWQKSSNISKEMPGAKQTLQRDRSYVKAYLLL